MTGAPWSQSLSNFLSPAQCAPAVLSLVPESGPREGRTKFCPASWAHWFCVIMVPGHKTRQTLTSALEMPGNPDRRETLRPLSVTRQYLQHRIRQGEGWTFKNQRGVRRLAGGPWTGFCRKRGRSWRREGCRLLVRGPGRKSRHDPGAALGACLSGVPSSLCAADVGSFLRQLLPAQCLSSAFPGPSASPCIQRRDGYRHCHVNSPPNLKTWAPLSPLRSVLPSRGHHQVPLIY